MSTLRRSLQFVGLYKGRTALAVLLGFLTVASNIGLMGTSGYLIASAALRPETVLLLWIPIVSVRFFGISRGVFRYLERLVSHDVTFRILARLRTWLYARIEPRAAVLLEERRSGDVLGSVISDVNEMQNLYQKVLAPVIVAVLSSVFGIGLAWTFHPRLGLVLAVLLALAGLAVPFGAYASNRRHSQASVKERAELYANASDLIMGLPELLLYGREQEAVERLGRSQQRLSAAQNGHNRTAAVTGGLLVALNHLALWGVLLVGIPLVADGSLAGVALPAVALIALASFEAVMPLPQTFQQYAGTMAAAGRLFRLADEGEAGAGETRNAAQSWQAQSPAEPVTSVSDHPELRISGLKLHYGQEAAALDGFTLTLPPGAKIAIVGESGAGKSTILQALLKLRPYQGGSISLAGTDIRQLPDEEVRSRFGVVTQHVQLFNATLRENVLLAKPDATAEELEQVWRDALLEDTIRGLPEGSDTLIGEWGAKLSGGERQRLALARALLRDAPILLFDEPLVGLDPLTERRLLSKLDSILRGRSLLWITHKLEGLEQMDEIVVLRQGRVRERGTHEELLKRQGDYWQLHQTESRRVIPG